MSNGLNEHLMLIVGQSCSGKSASLRNIRDQENWVYACTESGKALPFKNKFKSLNIVTPDKLTNCISYFNSPESKKDFECKGLIIDSLTFLLDQVESQIVRTSTNTQRAWAEYGDFFKTLFQQQIAAFNKPTIVTAHLLETIKDTDVGTRVTSTVPIKGALKGVGVEAYFSNIFLARKVAISDLEPFMNDNLHISEDEADIGYKYVIQTRPTKDVLEVRIRTPMGMFKKNETFIDNDAQILLDRLTEFYS